MANPLYGQNKADSEIASKSGSVKHLVADATLTAADSGKLISFTPPSSAGALDVTLPAHKDGLEFVIMQIAAYDTAVCNVASADGNDWVGNIDAQTGAGDNSATTDDKVVFGSGTVAGDYIKIVSSNGKWCVIGSCSKVTSNGVAFG